MFDRFLVDKSEYQSAEAYWNGLVGEILESLGATQSWQKWLTTSFGDGTPFADGDPICSLIWPAGDRCFKVIQTELGAIQDFGLELWFDEFEGRAFLVIRVGLNESTAALCRSFLAVWLDTRLPTEEAKRIVSAGAGSFAKK